MYHRDPTHTGAGPAQPELGSPRQVWAAQVDGAVYGEPLIAGDRVYVVTENDTVYALDAASGGVVWQHHVGTPVPRSALPCGDIDPSGFTATPAIDAGRREGTVTVTRWRGSGRMP
jgi:outer membrane protein assembly factor BamB